MLRRLLSLLVTLTGVVTLVFFLIHLIPGDPVEAMLGDSARVADREVLRHKLGLDLPVTEQYRNYIVGLLQFDLGSSLRNQQSVSSLLIERLPATVWLAVTALSIAVLIAIPLGVLAARRQGSLWDTGAMMLSLFGVAMPNFWLGPMLILLFSLWLGWTPVSGMEGLSSIILPAVTLGASMSAVLARMVRSSLLETLGEDYIRTALAKGVDESTVVWRHALRNAMLPLMTLMGLQLGALLGGAVITETVFAWPGIGSLMIESIQQRDYPVVQGCVLLIALVYVLVNAATDLVYMAIDPRISITERQ